MAGVVARTLNLRRGEGRALGLLASFLFLTAASITAISSAKNGLFLSVYPGDLIPHALVAAALVTAVVAVVFAGLVGGGARRRFAAWMLAFLSVTVVLGRVAFGIDPRSTFALYLWLSTVEVLLLTHAWDYVGDTLSGRQAKRLMPLIGIGASLGALVGGVSVAPVALALGTANVLVVGAGLALLSLAPLWALPGPGAGGHEATGDEPAGSALAAFLSGAGRGFRSILEHRLLRIMAASVILLSLTSTLIELQYKLALQSAFAEDQIAAVYGLMVSVVGLGTLVLQVAASRWIFPKLGVSWAYLIQAGLLAVASGAALALGGFVVRAALQVLDDSLQNSLDRPVEQISLLPFPGPIKSATVATLSGVLRPLSKAAGGLLAIALASRASLVTGLTFAFALGAGLVILRHRRLYLDALESALARHRIDFSTTTAAPLVADREALSVLDRGLADDDPMVVVFSLSLLGRMPGGEALPRARALLEHPAPEVRAEAAGVVGALAADDPVEARDALLDRLGREDDGFVLAALLAALVPVPEVPRARLLPFLEHPEGDVRRQTLMALAGTDAPDLEERVRAMLGSADVVDRVAAAGAAGELELVAVLPELRALVEDRRARPAALEALAGLGEPAVPVLAEILEDRALPLALRRGVVTTLAGVPRPMARDVLLSLVEEPALGPAALTSLRRLRSAGALEPVGPDALRSLLRQEIHRGYRYGLVATALGGRDPAGTGTDDETHAFLTQEMDGLRVRSLHRAVRILSLAYEPERLESVLRALGSGRDGEESKALELLDGMLVREDAALVVPFAEAGLDGVDPQEASAVLADAAEVHARPLEALLEDPDWWPRALALHALGRGAEIAMPGLDPDDNPTEGPDMIPLIERVMILKGSQLFRYFPGSDLAGIASLAEVVHLETDEVIFEQGDPGDAFYMVVRGSMRIMRGSVELALLGPREGFGEMAILDQETRSATAVGAEPTTLLRIDRDSFDRLIEQNPSVARGIYRMLTQRLRNTLAQVAAG